MADLETIEKKMESGEELTAEEKAEVMGAPNIVTKEDESSDENDEGGEQVDLEEKTGEKEGESEADKKEDEQPTEEPTSEKDGKTAEPKEEEKPAEEKQRTEEEIRTALEGELEKPPGQEDLEGYSQRERALFFEMRAERRKRQQAQTELDTLKFKDAKERALAKEREEQQAEEEPQEDPFKDRDDDEFMTIGDVREILTKRSLPAGKKSTPEQDKMIEQNKTLILRNWQYEGMLKYKDFNDVLQYAEEIIAGDPKLNEEVEATARAGGNAAITSYNLVKASPKWPEIEKKIKGAKQAEADKTVHEKRAEKIEKNEKKPNTTGSGGSGTPPPGEYTYNELLAMEDDDYAKLPPEKRAKILQKLG